MTFKSFIPQLSRGQQPPNLTGMHTRISGCHSFISRKNAKNETKILWATDVPYITKTIKKGNNEMNRALNQMRKLCKIQRTFYSNLYKKEREKYYHKFGYF